MVDLVDIKSCSIVIFGVSGDLAGRMLLPSLYFLHKDKYLPQALNIVGAARTKADNAAFEQQVYETLREYVPDEHFDEQEWKSFAERLSYVVVDASNPEDFKQLAQHLSLKEGDDLVCYLSTSQKIYAAICQNLKTAGLVTPNTRVVMEKPIGQSLESSQAINDGVSKIFPEKNIFRVDHYLGKETVQNILALRFANSLFEPLWNATDIDHVQITISETVGVEGRWAYYNESGALRDMVQNHMLQLLSLIAMEPPSDFDPDAVRNEKVKVLRSLRPIVGRDVESHTVRGQYTAGSVNGKMVPAYADEKGGGADSNIETFVALRAHIDNWRWAGVPFYLRTGKCLPYRYTEIFIQFREVPHSIFAKSGCSKLLPNKLIIRLQPEENITLLMMNKVPGLSQKGLELREVPLNLSLTEAFQKQRRRIAYERLFLDIIRHDTTLFVRRDEIEVGWSWLDDIQLGWQQFMDQPKLYQAGTWGPSAAFALTERHGHSWHE